MFNRFAVASSIFLRRSSGESCTVVVCAFVETGMLGCTTGMVAGAGAAGVVLPNHEENQPPELVVVAGAGCCAGCCSRKVRP